MVIKTLTYSHAYFAAKHINNTKTPTNEHKHTHTDISKGRHTFIYALKWCFKGKPHKLKAAIINIVYIM